MFNRIQTNTHVVTTSITVKKRNDGLGCINFNGAYIDFTLPDAYKPAFPQRALVLCSTNGSDRYLGHIEIDDISGDVHCYAHINGGETLLSSYTNPNIWASCLYYGYAAI